MKTNKQLATKLAEKVEQEIPNRIIRNLGNIDRNELKNQNPTIISVEFESKHSFSIEWDCKKQESIIKTVWSSQVVDDGFFEAIYEMKKLKKFCDVGIKPNLVDFE